MPFEINNYTTTSSVVKGLSNISKYNSRSEINNNETKFNQIKFNQINQDVIKTVTIINNSSHNAFNQAVNFRYKYNDLDI